MPWYSQAPRFAAHTQERAIRWRLRWRGVPPGRSRPAWPARTRQSPTRTAPRRNLKNRNDKGGIWSSAAFVAGKVAPQMRVVRSSANRGMENQVLFVRERSERRKSFVTVDTAHSVAARWSRPAPWPEEPALYRGNRTNRPPKSRWRRRSRELPNNVLYEVSRGRWSGRYGPNKS